MSVSSERHEISCYHIRWETLPGSVHNPVDCVNIGSKTHWYGGGEVRADRWTIEKQPMKMQPFLPSDIIQDREAYGSVLERYWLSSKGVGVYVDDSVPLHVSVNKEQLCFKAQYEDSPYKSSSEQLKLPVLDYKVCLGENVKAVHEFMAYNNWDRPQGIPDERMMKYPIWSTWARYKVGVDQNRVLEFASEITQHGFLGCQIEIDDMYTPTYGDFVFDKQKFPDPILMRKKLRNHGFKTTSWIMPFHNMDSQAFADGMEYEFFIKAANEDVPALTKWWQGTGAVLDVTKQSAVKWFGRRLQELREEGVDSFKFDAGEVNWLPLGSRTATPLKHIHHYTKAYAEAMYQISDNMAEVRAAYRNQNLPIFVRMMDKLSRWDYDLGLRTLIPTALTFGLIGYPFVLPDMVGGNAYGEADNLDDTILPDKELFIRWVQITAFMPAMQFSIAPWQYDKETIAISNKYVKLHESYIFPKVLKLARQAMTTGEPIIRPLWWADPNDKKTHGVDDQFLVGNEILVAPIVDKGATQRKIYLPKGRWRDMLHEKSGQVYEGGEMVWDYPIALDQIAYFERTS